MGHLISRSDEGFWWRHRKYGLFHGDGLASHECQRMKLFFVWRREGVGAFLRETERRSKIFIHLEGGEESREDRSDRSIGGFRLVREHVSGVGEDGGRK